nr:RPM1-interacting protein 4-like isoform X2 [Tanacetum cinerariifolium]
MAQKSQVPKFGNWEDQEEVPYTAYFERATKDRNAKTTPQFLDPSSNNGPSFKNQEESKVKNREFTKSQLEILKDQDSPRANQKSRISQEEVDLRYSTESSTNPKRVSRQSVGSNHSFGNNVSLSSEGSYGAASSTPGRSRLRQGTRGDETPDDGPVIPKFGDWDDNDPTSGERYTQVFNKVREDKHGGGGKSPMVTTENADFYGQRNESSKGCGCFPWSRK